ncbi:selenocysteine-specific translation elongation factor [Vagococcus elongatus]|uniref:Selenocysteine-specific elongation factor n=1 Tax=Vagococcus elongatus TaxID=180344 RepID=A0A430APT0_9ENTE|nr:selenocysteine-specific translation elongation factor [Vagococcus elongatus]RSU10138.1 selenocysteine-specific translation elongation factor [Vagococcus elongatus]
MEHIIIGTAGHVDHGKSTLIKRLTGIETDTTKEEKQRGLSINLGFAYFDLPSGNRAGIIDVPGHERFIKNMMAGLSGINLVLLVIDSTEGVMPQTKEHANILQLMGIEDYIIVMTKISLVDDDVMELVEEDIREQFNGTLLEEAPLVKVDAVDNIGITALIELIDKKRKKIEKKETAINMPRMHVDRVFTVKGFGTVVTGTLMDGQLTVGDEVLVYPSGKRTKIRNIQVHEQNVSRVYPHMRTALNLANIKVGEIKRGDTLAFPDTLKKTWMLDVKVSLLENFSLELWDRVRLHLGTREIMCRVVPIGVEEVSAGSEAYLQLRLEEEVVAKKGDRFILRSYSPMTTIGGGRVLDELPDKHRRFSEEVIEKLKMKEKNSMENLISDYMMSYSAVLISSGEISSYFGTSQEEITHVLEKMVDNHLIYPFGKKYLHAEYYEHFQDLVVLQLTDYHKKYRLREGMTKEELRTKIGLEMKQKDFDILLTKMAEDELVKLTPLVSLTGFKIVYNAYQQKDREDIEQKLLNAGFLAMKQDELTEGNKQRKEVLDSLIGKTVVQLDSETVLHVDNINQAVSLVKTHIQTHGKLTLAEFRDLIGASRKYAVLILDYLDKCRITERVDDYRILTVEHHQDEK